MEGRNIKLIERMSILNRYYGSNTTTVIGFEVWGDKGDWRIWYYDRFWRKHCDIHYDSGECVTYVIEKSEK